MNGLEGGVPNISADSHVRDLSGLLAGAGILFLARAVVLGGLAPLPGLRLTGVPSPTILAALGMELAVTPLLRLWQARGAGRARDTEAIVRTDASGTGVR